MKTTLLAVLAFAVSTSAVCADQALPARLGLAPLSVNIATSSPGDSTAVPSLSLATPASATTADFKLESSSSSFAQLGTSVHAMPLALPLSPGLIAAFVAVFVLALRIIGLNHARALADHERDSYRGKEKMFRTLHERDSIAK